MGKGGGGGDRRRNVGGLEGVYERDDTRVYERDNDRK